MRYLAVVDGEHYPPVVQDALERLAAHGDDVVAAILVGGREKLPAEGIQSIGDVRVESGGDALSLLEHALVEHRPDEVVDLSDEPVLDYRMRHQLAAVALYHGIPYRGPDFRFTPPPRPRLTSRPSLAIIGTGKRTGKTAAAGFAVRTLAAAGYRPAVVSMGRGGPQEPELLRGDLISLTPEDLLRLADEGKHAASDYVEDAMLGRVPTVGCRRCGGGLAGGVGVTNFDRGVAIADELDVDLLIYEGSGAAIPPASADATVLVVPASIPEEHLRGYMGPYRLLLADTVVVTMCEEPFGSSSQISRITSLVRGAWRSISAEHERDVRVVRTVFRPEPVRSVEGATAIVATTAPHAAGDVLRAHLQDAHGCRISAIVHSLSDRRALTEELARKQPEVDTLLCEIKAAGVDVATRWALQEGLDVVYMDNVPHGVEGDDPAEAVLETARLAVARSARIGL